MDPMAAFPSVSVCDTHGNGVQEPHTPPMKGSSTPARRFEPPPDCRRIVIAGAGGFGREVLQWARETSTTVPPEEAVLEAAAQCLQALQESRAREGAKLVAVLLERTRTLRELAARAAPLVPQVVQRQQARFLERPRRRLTSACRTSRPRTRLSTRCCRAATAWAPSRSRAGRR